MYGQPEIERPAILKMADADFIDKASNGLFGSKEEASKFFYAQAEKFMAEGNLDFAMRRYNQSWLLNPNNYQPYWGFARVLIQQGQIDDGLPYFKKAEKLIDDPYQKVALLSDMGSAYSYKGQTTPSYFDKANKKFSESVELDPNYANAWRRWAFSLYKQGNYADAWHKVRKVESLNARPFSRAFLAELASKSPRP
jgi:tetratricopeptide (TPR) repeat protein